MNPPAIPSDVREFFDPALLARLEPFSVRAARLLEGLTAGLHRSPRRGFATEFSEHRAYTPGDDPRHLDWRAFARSDRLLIKQHQDESHLRSMLLLDGSRSMRGLDGSKFQYGQLLCLALAWVLLRQNDAVGFALLAPSDPPWLVPASHAGRVPELTSLLQACEPVAMGPLHESLAAIASRLPRRALIWLLSDLFDEPQQLRIEWARLARQGHEVRVLHLVDRRERSWPFEAEVEVVGLEGEGSVQVSSPGMQDAYAAAFREFESEIQAQCDSAGIAYTQVETNLALHEALALVLARQ